MNKLIVFVNTVALSVKPVNWVGAMRWIVFQLGH